MGTKRRKGRQEEAGGQERRGEEREGPSQEASDPREEEGYGQPESSAQRAPRGPDEEGPPGHPE
jgi:hypothetical protein